MIRKYDENLSEVALMTFGILAKYSALMGGIYSVCKNPPEVGLTAMLGLVYFIGDLSQKTAENDMDIRRLNLLEKELKNKF